MNSATRQENSTVGSESTPVSHSKGPWETGRDLHGYESHYGGPSIYSADQYMVAETLLGTDDTEGNARLIAAAPEMFAALQAAQKRLEQIDDNSTEAIAVRLVVGIALAKAVQS